MLIIIKNEDFAVNFLNKRLTQNKNKGGRIMELLFIYMDGCPYCKLAGEVLEDLYAGHPEYKKIPLVKVNENREPEKLKGRNYYYVPTFFYGEEKIYEAQPGDGREKMEKILGDFFKKAVD